MKRWVSHSFIAIYLSVLVYGLACHALYFRINQHPAMYFVVWDMFCGWTAYETRLHVVGEGVSGRYYELAPGPWGEMQPFGDLDRRHHDHTRQHAHRIGLNTLRHTDHEPMARLLVIDEAWPRKYNLPDHLWRQRYPEPKDPVSYYQVEQIRTPTGQIVQQSPAWLVRLASDCVMDNPRLRADVTRGRPYYAVNPHWRRDVRPASHTTSAGD